MAESNVSLNLWNMGESIFPWLGSETTADGCTHGDQAAAVDAVLCTPASTCAPFCLLLCFYSYDDEMREQGVCSNTAGFVESKALIASLSTDAVLWRRFHICRFRGQ